MSGTITKVSGPLVVAEGLADANVSDVVRVGSQRLIGEILNMTGDRASIQVYEETSGLGPGANVETTGMPMSVELGPGMLDNIYDGIQRPLPEMRALTGDCITRGTDVPALNREKKWDFVPVAKPGDKLTAGDVLGTIQETSAMPANLGQNPSSPSSPIRPRLRIRVTILRAAINRKDPISSLINSPISKIPTRGIRPISSPRPQDRRVPPSAVCGVGP